MTQKNFTGLPRYSLSTSFNDRNSAVHGAHQVAPNETNTTFPRVALRSTIFPSSPRSLNVGSDGGVLPCPTANTQSARERIADVNSLFGALLIDLIAPRQPRLRQSES